ncbi:hypothetical protein Avbf_14309 [Armadillidium vulgare]|nr:hypothetical protein Avbf_14309 [Armadillidium vulgare]
MKICKNSTKLKYRDRQNVAAFSVLSCRRRCVSLFLSRKQEKFDLETLINITTDVAAELIPKPFGFHMKLLNCIKKYKTQLSDPEELSSNVNVNAGNEPISRKKKLHDGVDTEDSSAVAISSAAMPKQLKICKTRYCNFMQILFLNYFQRRIHILTSFHLKRTAYNRKEPKENSLRGTGMSVESFANLDYIQNKILKARTKKSVIKVSY